MLSRMLAFGIGIVAFPTRGCKQLNKYAPLAIIVKLWRHGVSSILFSCIKTHTLLTTHIWKKWATCLHKAAPFPEFDL